MKRLLISLLGVLTALCAAHAAPLLEKTRLAEHGEDGYVSIRIPAVTVTPKGTILCFFVGRFGVSDWAENNILMVRSPDGGKTWGPKRIVVKGDGDTADNPVPYLDRATGRVGLIFQRNYKKIYQILSDDEGQTWSAPQDISDAFERYRPEYDWTVVAPGPGHALQTKSGRIVVPFWMCKGKGKAHRPSVVSAVHSDDGGKTWQRGDILPDTMENMSETVAVEGDDGAVMLFVRNESRDYRYAVSVSKDGATGWSTPALVDDLYNVICFGAAARVSDAKTDGKSRLVFCAPDSRPDTTMLRKWGGRPREHLTVRLSEDGGKTWKVSKVLEAGRAGYSDLFTAPDGAIICLYEHGVSPEGNPLNTRFVDVARFNIEWLTDGADAFKNPEPKK